MILLELFQKEFTLRKVKSFLRNCVNEVFCMQIIKLQCYQDSFFLKSFQLKGDIEPEISKTLLNLSIACVCWPHFTLLEGSQYHYKNYNCYPSMKLQWGFCQYYYSIATQKCICLNCFLIFPCSANFTLNNECSEILIRITYRIPQILPVLGRCPVWCKIKYNFNADHTTNTFTEHWH